MNNLQNIYSFPWKPLFELSRISNDTWLGGSFRSIRAREIQ